MRGGKLDVCNNGNGKGNCDGNCDGNCNSSHTEPRSHGDRQTANGFVIIVAREQFAKWLCFSMVRGLRAR